MNTDDRINKLKLLLIKSLNETYPKDKHLYKNNLCERCKVFRIGVILSQKINEKDEYLGYSVDCEYNKRGDQPKNISSENPQSPDLMIHRRGDDSDKNSLLSG